MLCRSLCLYCLYFLKKLNIEKANLYSHRTWLNFDRILPNASILMKDPFSDVLEIVDYGLGRWLCWSKYWLCKSKDPSAVPWSPGKARLRGPPLFVILVCSRQNGRQRQRKSQGQLLWSRAGMSERPCLEVEGKDRYPSRMFPRTHCPHTQMYTYPYTNINCNLHFTAKLK